jgi:hypothetical protein
MSSDPGDPGILRCPHGGGAPTPAVKPYSVLLLYPDYLASTYGEETYYDVTHATSPEEALARVRTLARSLQGPQWAEMAPTDFGCLAVFEGHHVLLLSSYDGA